MALNLLTIEEMVYITQPLVTPGDPVRVALERVPGLDALMPHVDKAFNGLLVAMEKGQVQSLTEIGEALGAVDRKHDGLARAVFYALESQINLARGYEDEETAGHLQALQMFLFPDELRVVQYSYRDEAGHAQLITRRIKPEHESWLAGIPMPGGSLLDTVNAWLDAGTELGELERERDKVNVPSRRLHITRARSLWIRAIRTVRQVIELTDVQDSVIEEALGRIYAAEIAANPRAHGQVPESGAGRESDGSETKPRTILNEVEHDSTPTITRNLIVVKP